MFCNIAVNGPLLMGTYQVQTNLTVQTLQTSIWATGSTSKEGAQGRLFFWELSIYLSFVQRNIETQKIALTAFFYVMFYEPVKSLNFVANIIIRI